MEAITYSQPSLTDKYTIVARYMDGVNVIGYHLIDSNGNGLTVTKEDVKQLALNKMLLNAVGQRYKDDIVIKGINCKLSELPVIDVSSGKLKGNDIRGKMDLYKFKIVGRITKGKNTIGYVLRDPQGMERKVKRSDVLKLAREGKLSNARAQAYNGKLLLRGVGFELAQLPVIRV